MSKMTLKTEGDRHVVVTRRFAAAPEAVYRAHTEPALIQKWLLGPDGWTMPVCINEARPGGKIRYEWTNGEGAGFLRHRRVSRTGAVQPSRPRRADAHARCDARQPRRDEFCTRPHRYVDDHAHDLAHDAATRTAMLSTGMEHGMEASYVRLEGTLNH